MESSTVAAVNLLTKCTCGSTDADGDVVQGIQVLRCTACGVVRQLVGMTEAELTDWYRDHYLSNTYQHAYAHDYAVARERLNAYQITPGSKLLDVGSGRGAFIEAAREVGIDAWGQELASSSDSRFTYIGNLESIAFPTDDFDVVTLHDVLEHVVDPRALLAEVRRIIKRPGKVIIDFPNFYSEHGVHHWKQTEHLWMFTKAQLVRLVQEAGFRVTSTSHPIASKFLVEAEALPEKRPQILIPAGIGDAWWVMTKLPGFLRTHRLGIPDVWVQDNGGPKRTRPYLRTLPFIHGAGYKKLADDAWVFEEGYRRDGRTVFPNEAGVDYFIAYNGVLGAGKSLEVVDPQYGCDWRPRMHVSKESLAFRDRLAGAGPYVLTYWVEAGMYRFWLQEFGPEKIIKALKLIEESLGARIIFMGATWDQGQIGRAVAEQHPEWTDLIGSTTYDQMIGAIMGATAVVGHPAGNTMMATYFNVPTVLLWHKYFVKPFWSNTVPPDSRYFPLDVSGLEPLDVATTLKALVEDGRDPSVSD